MITHYLQNRIYVYLPSGESHVLLKTLRIYLSKEMAQRWRVETVEAWTSIEFQKSQTAEPNIHLKLLHFIIN